jgi:orotate phosphoribosyltransferase
MQDELIKLLAGRRGHFQMESGYHSEWWFNLDVLFDQTERLRPFLGELARRLAAHRIDAVCGPMTGGAKLAELIAAELGIGCFFTERFEQPAATGLFPVKYRLPAARRDAARRQRIAIVDDAVSAGSAARGTYNELVSCGAQPVVLGALFVFGDQAARFAAESGQALECIAHTSFGMWPPAECPLCKSAVPVERVSDAV